MTDLALLSKLQTEHLSFRAYRVLLEIEMTPETMVHISGVVETSAQNLSGIVRGLEQRKLVGRVKEGRNVQVGITEAGKELLARIEQQS